MRKARTIRRRAAGPAKRNRAIPALLALGGLLALGSLLAGCGEKAVYPELRGPYLGQAPPGMEPALFAPGVVSTGFYERDLAVTSDGAEIFYGLVFGGHVTIMHTRLANGVWTEPEIAPFARDLSCFYFEPALSPDGKRLYFLCTRAPAGQEPKRGWAHQNIWAVDRGGDGSWGEPYIVGPPVSTDAEEYFPSVTRDGTIYFTRLVQGSEENNVWRARLVNGAYAEAEMLPDEINGTPASPPTRASSSPAWGGATTASRRGSRTTTSSSAIRTTRGARASISGRRSTSPARRRSRRR